MRSGAVQLKAPSGEKERNRRGRKSRSLTNPRPKGKPTIVGRVKGEAKTAKKLRRQGRGTQTDGGKKENSFFPKLFVFLEQFNHAGGEKRWGTELEGQEKTFCAPPNAENRGVKTA